MYCVNIFTNGTKIDNILILEFITFINIVVVNLKYFIHVIKSVKSVNILALCFNIHHGSDGNNTKWGPLHPTLKL